MIEVRDCDLDIEYRRRWTPVLDIADWLDRALAEARELD